MIVETGRSVVIYGAGTMGAGIATLFARAGWSVTCVARTDASLARAAAYVYARLERQPDDPRNLINFYTDPAAGLSTADLVIESIQESFDAKRDLLALIGESIAPQTIITTNTSSIDIVELSRHVRGPQRFAGLHWFNPPESVELVEIVLGPHTEQSVVERLDSWVSRLGKTAVTVKRPAKGFIANRLQYALLREAYALVEMGVCSWEDVDLAVVKGLGPRWAAVGPFQSMDMAGLDVHEAVANALFPELSCAKQAPAALTAMVAAGNLGCKSGEGLLGNYDAGRVEELVKRRSDVLSALAR